MKPIAVFYHTKISGGDPPIDFNHAISIVAEQLFTLKASGLVDVATEVFIGINGDESDTAAICSLAPEKAIVVQSPEGSKGEHPTLRMLQEWCYGNEDAYVLYLHTKGATHLNDPVSAAWRECMMRAVVHNWRDCVKALDGGFDAAGPHWVGPEIAVAPVPNYFAGNFWWCKARFINTLPLIHHTAVERLNFYDAEVLIARGPKPARAMKFCRHWPGAKCLEAIQSK